MGYRRAIKPDILASGGRVVVREQLATGGNEPARLGIYGGALAPGSPRGCARFDGRRFWRPRSTRGAPATRPALISRAAGSLYEVLEELRNDPGGELIDVVPRAVWLKALIAHGADWGTVAETLRNGARAATTRCDSGNERHACSGTASWTRAACAIAPPVG